MRGGSPPPAMCGGAPPLTIYEGVPSPPPPPMRVGALPPPPPPPLLLPTPMFGARGAAVDLTGRERGLADKKKSYLKLLHWTWQGSFWDELQRDGEGKIAPEFDVLEIETLFSAKVQKQADESGGRLKSVGEKPKRVQLIELRRANCIEIMLTKIKMPLPDMMAAVLAMDDSILDVDQIESFIKFFPTKEEMELLKNYTGDKTTLGKCEQFFLEVMKVPRVESKLGVLSFKIQFATQITELITNLNLVNFACKEILTSKMLKAIMKNILYLGNALNQGTAWVAAVGFRLDSLMKLSNTRSANGKMNLMHYLCKVLDSKASELLDFHKDLGSLESASKIKLKYLAEEMKAIAKGLEKSDQELAASGSDGPVSKVFHKTLKDFISSAETEFRTLLSLYSVVSRNVDTIAYYFGEDPRRCPYKQVTGTLLNFTRLFKKAHEENLEQAELEKKKDAKEAKRDIIVYGAGSRSSPTSAKDFPSQPIPYGRTALPPSSPPPPQPPPFRSGRSPAPPPPPPRPPTPLVHEEEQIAAETKIDTISSAPVQKPADKSDGAKPKKVHLINRKRAHDTELMLTKVMMPLPDFVAGVLEMDDSLIDVDLIENLIKFCPTKEEMVLLKNYRGDKTTLGKYAQYFLELMKVPRVNSKLKVISFKIQLGTQRRKLTSLLNFVNSACEEVRTSQKLKEIMKRILYLGNILDKGTARGAAVGFKLRSLLRLCNKRARKSNMTLMHYLCKVLDSNASDLLDFHKDLESLESASKIQLKYLDEKMQAIIKGFEKLKLELAASESDGPVSHGFYKTLKDFIPIAEIEVAIVSNLYLNVRRNAEELLYYFGEDPNHCTFEEVIVTLFKFTRLFKEVHEERLANESKMEKASFTKEAVDNS